MDRVSYSNTVKHSDVTLSSVLMELLVQSHGDVDVTGCLHDHIKDGRFTGTLITVGVFLYVL